MKYCTIKDNHLLIVNAKGEIKEDATENLNECEYCVYNKEFCDASKITKECNGQFCDLMKCEYENFDGEVVE